MTKNTQKKTPKVLLSQNTLLCSYLTFATLLFAVCIFFVIMFLLGFYPPMMMEFGGEWLVLQLLGIFVTLFVFGFFVWTWYTQGHIIVALFQNEPITRSTWKGILFVLVALFVFVFFFHAFWSSLQFLINPSFDSSFYLKSTIEFHEMYQERYQQGIFFIVLWFSGWTSYLLGALYLFGALRSYSR